MIILIIIKYFGSENGLKIEDSEKNGTQGLVGNVHLYNIEISFFLRLTNRSQIEVKLYRKHLYEGGTNVFINNQDHITKVAAVPKYEEKKNFKNLLLRKCSTYCHKT